MLKLRGDRCSQIISGVFTVLLKVAVLQGKDQRWQWKVEDPIQQIFCREAILKGTRDAALNTNSNLGTGEDHSSWPPGWKSLYHACKGYGNF